MWLLANIVLIFSACSWLATVVAVPGNFPRGKTVVYNYYSDVNAGIVKETSHISQFALNGTLYVKHDTSDPTLQNAFHVAFSNVTIRMYNGKSEFRERKKEFIPISYEAKIIEEPFLIVFDENGKLEGVKIPVDEAGWSKNIKMAIASMLQLNTRSMSIEELTTNPRSFISKEKTIHGDCWMNYHLSATHPESSEIIVSKLFWPKKCSGFVVHEFDRDDHEGCQTKTDESFNVTSQRSYKIEKQEMGNILIKELVSYGQFNNIPWTAKSGTRYVETNTTLILDKLLPDAQSSLRTINFKNIPMIRDLTYQKPQGKYAANAAVDITHGRHVIDINMIVTNLKTMLGEAADYLEENHLDILELDSKKGQVINKILRAMSKMDSISLKHVFDDYKKSTAPRDLMIKAIFLAIVPHVGTTASTIFVLQLIRTNEIADNQAVTMLAKLPVNVRVPDELLIVQMEDFVNLGDILPIEVRKAGILCFASMIYKKYKDSQNLEDSPHLRRYLRDFFYHVKSEPDKGMKIAYLMALKNIQVGKIHELLAPIVRGDLTNDTVSIRLHAIWAIEKAIESDYRYACDLLWPVMADKTIPVKLRIAAYEILMRHASTNAQLQKIHEFMVNEANEHLYNYHYTTIKEIANSFDPCKDELRENIRKIMRYTRIPDNHRFMISSAYSIGYEDSKYGHAEKINMAIMINEFTGFPEVLQFEHITITADKPVSNIAIRLHITSHSNATNDIWQHDKSVTAETILNVLREAAMEMPGRPNIDCDMIIMSKGRVVRVDYLDNKSFNIFLLNMGLHSLLWASSLKMGGSIITDSQIMMYDSDYEKQVTSDIGIPIILETRIPMLTSSYGNITVHQGKKYLNLGTKLWRHGAESISIYNPIADAWHSVIGSTVTDVSVSIAASYIIGGVNNSFIWSTNYARRQDSISPNFEFRTYAKDSVSVSGDHLATLSRTCALCSHEVDASPHSSRVYHDVMRSEDTGLRYTMSAFDCERKVTATKLGQDFYRAFSNNMMNDLNNVFIRTGMALHHQYKNLIIAPQMGGCGIHLKIEPSYYYRISRVDFTVHSIMAGNKTSLSVDLISASTNTPARTWAFNFESDFRLNSTETTMNMFKMQITQKIPGEADLQICADLKRCLSTPTDPLELVINKEEINSELSIIVRRNSENKCVHDDTSINITVKAELSSEQKEQFLHEITEGACGNDIKNPLFANPKNLVPKTPSCLDALLHYTTLKKYTIDVAHKEVPETSLTMLHQLEDILRSYYHYRENLHYNKDRVDVGKIRINAEYSEKEDAAYLSVVTPTNSYNLTDIKLKRPLFVGFRTGLKPMQHWELQNTRINTLRLFAYTKNIIKTCSVYPQITINPDGMHIPYNVSEQWTLIYGDNHYGSTAVFVKMNGDNMAVSMTSKYENEIKIDIIPVADNNVQIIANGNVIDSINNETLKVIKINDHVYVNINWGFSRMQDLSVVYGLNHVALLSYIVDESRCSGLCGHLEYRRTNKIPHVYTTLDLLN